MTEPRPAGLARRPAVLTVVVAFALVAVLAAWLVPWSWVPGGRLVPARASALFTPGQIARMERYSWLRRGLGWTPYFLTLALLLALAFTARGARLVRRATSRRRWWLGVPAGVLLVLVLERLLALPFAVAGHVVDRDYGISRQGWGGWLGDQARSLGVSWFATSLVLLVLVLAARRSPRWWFAWAGAAALLLGFAGSFLYPVLVEPLFNRFTPMAAGPFKSSILRLADREGVHVDDVLVADASRRTTTLNAYVSGLGSTRRVVVYDNLLKDLTPAQARVVIAHELGHAKHQDVLLGHLPGRRGERRRRRAAGAAPRRRAACGARARVSGPADPAVVALVLALAGVGGFIVSPLQNTVSRAIEARADRTSLETTHADATFVQMQRRLALTSLARPDAARLEPAVVGQPSDRAGAGRVAAVAAGGRPVSRVLVVTNDFPTRRGGIESFVLALCREMPADEVVVYTASMPGGADFDATLPFPVYRDPSRVLLPTPAVARRVRSVMRRHGCDRVLFGASAPLGLLAPSLRRAGARRQVALTHGHEVWWARTPGARRLLRRVGDEVDVLTYVSEWCREHIAPALSPAARDRMVRLSPGVDTERFHPGCGGAEVRRRLGFDATTPVVVCTARMVRRKGQDTLIRAWPEVLRSHPGARLLLVGDGPDRSRLERLADRVDVRGAVVFTGWCAVGGGAGLHRRGRRLRHAVPDPAARARAGGVGDRVPGGPGVRAAGGRGSLRRGPGDGHPGARAAGVGSGRDRGRRGRTPVRRTDPRGLAAGRGRGDVVAPRRSGPRRPVGGVTCC